MTYAYIFQFFWTALGNKLYDYKSALAFLLNATLQYAELAHYTDLPLIEHIMKAFCLF